MTPRKAVLVLYAAGIGVSAVALLHQSTLGNGSRSGLLLVVFCCIVLAAIRYLGYSEFTMAGKMLLRGDLGRILAAHIDLRALENAISRATTPAACADLVVASVEGLGCLVTRLRFAGHVSGSHSVVVAPAWTFRVPLDNGDFVELAREFGDSSSSAHVGLLVDVLRGSLVAKGRTFTRPLNTGPQKVPGRLVVGEELAIGQAADGR